MATKDQIYLLKKKKDETALKINEIKKEQNTLNKALSKCQKTLNSIEKQLAAFNNTKEEIEITEHAKLRYVNRVLGIDAEKEIQEIIKTHKDKIDVLGSGIINIGGFEYVFRNRILVTIQKKEI